MVFNEWGAPTTGRMSRFTVGLDADATDRPRSGIVYSLSCRCKPGGYQVRFAVRDATSGALGAAGEFVDMPDVKKGAFALSGVVLGEESQAAPTPDDGTATVARVSNPALRVFDRARAWSTPTRSTTPPSPVDTTVVVWRDGRPFFSAPPSTLTPLPKRADQSRRRHPSSASACLRATTSSRSSAITRPAGRRSQRRRRDGPASKCARHSERHDRYGYTRTRLAAGEPDAVSCTCRFHSL